MVSLKVLTFLELKLICEKDNIQEFDCGVSSLNDFLIKHSVINQMRRLSATTVASQKGDPQQRIVGYYTLSPAQVDVDAFPNKIARGLPKYPIPAIRLCRLAVDSQFQGMNYGRELLGHALHKCYQQSKEIGGFCIVVDAINEKSKAFYEKIGFIPLSKHPNSLMMLTKTIESHLDS